MRAQASAAPVRKETLSLNPPIHIPKTNPDQGDLRDPPLRGDLRPQSIFYGNPGSPLSGYAVSSRTAGVTLRRRCGTTALLRWGRFAAGYMHKVG